MSEPTEHVYVPTTLIDRLAEVRAILEDERSKIGDMTQAAQKVAADHLGQAIETLGAAPLL